MYICIDIILNLVYNIKCMEGVLKYVIKKKRIYK